MRTSEWNARRRGDAVTIAGFVSHPRAATPIFEKIPDQREDTCALRFYFNPPHLEPCTTDYSTWVTFTVPHVPRTVRRLKIAVYTGETVIIESQQPAS